MAPQIVDCDTMSAATIDHPHAQAGRMSVIDWASVASLVPDAVCLASLLEQVSPLKIHVEIKIPVLDAPVLKE